MPEWDPPQKPAEYAESRLIESILEGCFPVDSRLPGERELSSQLGVTRPTLREALQRLARDGWVEIRHGRATRVRNYWQEGNLAVLSAMVRHPDHLPEDFVSNLLAVRAFMAPEYTRLAVQNEPGTVVWALEACLNLAEAPEAYSQADWKLHHTLTIASGNPVFTLILNGFEELYQVIGSVYFTSPGARHASHAFYLDLREAVQAGDPQQAAEVTRNMMSNSLRLWRIATSIR